jgi:hypothetical protein
MHVVAQKDMESSYSIPYEAQDAGIVPDHTYSQQLAGEIVLLYHTCPLLFPGDMLPTAAVALGTGADGSDTQVPWLHSQVFQHDFHETPVLPATSS